MALGNIENAQFLQVLDRLVECFPDGIRVEIGYENNGRRIKKNVQVDWRMSYRGKPVCVSRLISLDDFNHARFSVIDRFSRFALEEFGQIQLQIDQEIEDLDLPDA